MFLPSNITLKFGDSGDFVAELQRRLAMVKCFAEDQVNGFYDGTTVNAVTAFQGREGLHADGVAGPETLRRLNGVIAGDTSGSSDKKEEEAQAVTQAAITQDIMQTPLEPAYDPFAVQPATHSPFGEEAYKPAPEVKEAPAMRPLPAGLDAPQQANEQAMQQQMAQQAMQQQAVADLLAPAPKPQSEPPLQKQAAHTVAAKPEVPPVPQQPLEQKPVMQQQGETPAAEQPQQQPKGIVGRAVQFANSMMQKLADYFEAKLPPSVLKEVQSIGVTMAAAGLKEAPIPQGPEMAAPTRELPTRGPEQQATQQRS